MPHKGAGCWPPPAIKPSLAMGSADVSKENYATALDLVCETIFRVHLIRLLEGAFIRSLLLLIGADEEQGSSCVTRRGRERATLLEDQPARAMSAIDV